MWNRGCRIIHVGGLCAGRTAFLSRQNMRVRLFLPILLPRGKFVRLDLNWIFQIFGLPAPACDNFNATECDPRHKSG